MKKLLIVPLIVAGLMSLHGCATEEPEHRGQTTTTTTEETTVHHPVNSTTETHSIRTY